MTRAYTYKVGDMSKKDDPFREIMREVTANLTNNLRDVLAATLEKQLTESLTQSLLESEFYRKVSKDMRNGLKRIYREVSAAQNAASSDIESETVPDKATADKLFKDASDQLSAVLSQTEDAANTIMGIVEKHMDLQAESSELLEKARKGRITPDEWQRLNSNNATLGDDMIALMTAMSFQDLTGQRIKKAVAAIRQLESTVLELYVSSGIIMKAYEEQPGQSMGNLEEITKATMADIKQVVNSELKGPGSDASQGDIDALLAQFGL